MRFLEDHFRSRVQPKVTRSEIWTHRLCSNSSPRKAFLSSLNHRNLRISLRVTFGCSLLWKWHFAPTEDIKWNSTAELQKIPKEAFCRCFQQWQDRWSKRVCARHCHMSNHYSVVPHFWELFGCPSHCVLIWPRDGRITAETCCLEVNTLRTGDADLRLYVTTVQDGWCKSAFLTSAWFPARLRVLDVITQYMAPVS
jgi:hypothetical protein